MADETPSLQIDTDWKKQAQEEKRRLAEQQQQKAAEPTTPGTAMPSPRAPRDSKQPGQREIPAPSFATLVQSIVTQALFYLGDLSVRGSEPVVNLDMAKHHIDTLSVLEEKTANNLNEDEKRIIDSALYEARMRYVNVASQYIS